MQKIGDGEVYVSTYGWAGPNDQIDAQLRILGALGSLTAYIWHIVAFKQVRHSQYLRQLCAMQHLEGFHFMHVNMQVSNVRTFAVPE